MITSISIENYKSIDKLDFSLGRVNVLIGENGAGKSNILEAIALAGAAVSDKLDNEFLSSRGIRVTRPEYMRPAFPGFQASSSIVIDLQSSDHERMSLKVKNDNEPYSKWQCEARGESEEAMDIANVLRSLESFLKENSDKESARREIVRNIESWLQQVSPDQEQAKQLPKSGTPMRRGGLKNVKVKLDSDGHFGQYLWKQAYKRETIESLGQFIIYSPENSSLRIFEKEGQIEPLGINGEGLLRLMSVLHADNKYAHAFLGIRQSLRVLGWFEDLDIIDDENKPASRIEIRDRYIDSTRRYFDQISTNEGFLFLVFYFSLFSCDLTPRFFAVDNIDASLNPKLCSLLMEQLVALAKAYNKQVVLTTHNPAILDGLNLDDDDQRLFVTSRNRKGYTRLKRVVKEQSTTTPIRLSEAFLRGSLGGLPKGF